MVKEPWIFYKHHNKKMQLHQKLDVDIMPPACNFIGNKTPAKRLPCKFCKFFQPAALSKTRPQYSSFLANFEKFFTFQLY